MLPLFRVKKWRCFHFFAQINGDESIISRSCFNKLWELQTLSISTSPFELFLGPLEGLSRDDRFMAPFDIDLRELALVRLPLLRQIIHSKGLL